jgi:DNA replicative helicase MCM subunit Mcm2 (Cdc46/Mcm family)
MSYRSKPREEWTRLFTTFLLRPAGLRALKNLVETRKDHVGFAVNCQDLIEWDAAVCFALLQHPKELLPLFDDALRDAQQALLRSALAAAREDWAQRKAR